VTLITSGMDERDERKRTSGYGAVAICVGI
jgi:hypothetical protein